nr:unnamed protein product [Spirometra erinaceieuropaei]
MTDGDERFRQVLSVHTFASTISCASSFKLEVADSESLTRFDFSSTADSLCFTGESTGVIYPARLQNQWIKLTSPRVSEADLLCSSDSGQAFYVCDGANCRRVLVSTGAQINEVSPTSADHRCSNLSYHFQVANRFPISKFGSLSLALNIGLSRLFFSPLWLQMPRM